MSPEVAFAFDAFACLFLVAGLLGTIKLAPERPFFVSVSSVMFLVVLACAILSCSTPSTSPSPRPEKTKSPCVVTLEAFCKKGGACGFFDARECVAKGAAECDSIQGLSPTEAEVCADALSKTSCRELVPVECMSIAEPSPQPDTRQL